MTFPMTLEQLRAAGYRFDNLAYCRGCGALIEWWITPAGKRMPMDVTDNISSAKTQAHWATCPKAQDFRKDKRA